MEQEGRKVGRFEDGSADVIGAMIEVHRCLVVGAGILVELKAVERLLPIHEAQVVTYLRLARLSVGLLVNFNTIALRDGLRRLTAEHPKSFRSSALPVKSLFRP